MTIPIKIDFIMNSILPPIQLFRIHIVCHTFLNFFTQKCLRIITYGRMFESRIQKLNSNAIRRVSFALCLYVIEASSQIPVNLPTHGKCPRALFRKRSKSLQLLTVKKKWRKILSKSRFLNPLTLGRDAICITFSYQNNCEINQKRSNKWKHNHEHEL